MSLRVNHFKLGVFILSATALFVLALIFLGLGALRKDKVMVETYFEESVQGLDVGSPLKFKGVKIGSIERIRFAFNKYHDIRSTPFRYVLVEMALDLDSTLNAPGGNSLKDEIETEVARGLRIRIAPQGLTGTAYLEMDYTDPGRNVPLPIAWTPEYYYVPSAPSTIARMEETFEVFSKTLRRVEEAGVDQAVQNINELLVAARQAVADAQVGNVAGNLNALLVDLRRTTDNLGAMVGSPDAREAVRNLSAALADIKTSTEALPATIENLRKVLRDVNALLTSQRDEVQSILQQGRQVFENLNDLTGEAKRNPSRLFFGGPPAKATPEKR